MKPPRKNAATLTRAQLVKRWKDAKRAKGLCPKCGLDKPRPNRKECAGCAAYGSAYAKARKQGAYRT